MTTTDKVIKMFGTENPITIAITLLEELGKADLAKQLFEECEELAYPHWAQDDDDVDECGFDPYEGCYTYDC